MDRIKTLGVYCHGRKVGTLALYKEYFAAFQYDGDWLSEGFSISPLSLPLQNKVFIPAVEPFDGLFGVFSDSLSDGWGRLLLDRMLKKNGVDPYILSPIERLAIVGDTGMGALTYKPEYERGNAAEAGNLDHIAQECRRILNEETPESLDELFELGGSSGGARPKILTKIDGEDWIIKFPASVDGPDAGLREYEYSLCARECGIDMEETRLFDSEICSGYFGTKRFDRISEDGKERRVHMVSASALLETSHRIPNLDYDLLMKLTLRLSKDFFELEKLYRLMCFNVYAHNRDDHSKNFSYLYNETENIWQLSPAYDLTYSNSLGGEHATSVHGEGKDPQTDDLLAVAKEAGISMQKAKAIAQEVEECVHARLGKYL